MRWLPLLLAACGGPVGEPLIEAHRAGAGYWPENSRTAVRESLAAGFDGIEVDLVLTADLVPVLSHDPWLHVDRCTHADGAPLQAPVTIAELTLEELTDGYRCGGLPDPAFANAVLVADTLMTLDELLTRLPGGDPRTMVHLDIKVEEPDTPPPEDFAAAILDRWYAADLPNPWYVSANQPEVLAAFRDHGRLRGQHVPTALIYPRFPPGASSTKVALGSELRLALGTEDYVALAEEAGADGILLYWELADRHRLQAARAAGLTTGLWTLNGTDLLERHMRWPVDILITDYPGDLP